MPPAQCSGLMSSAHSYFHGQAHLTHLWKTWKQDEIRQNIPSYIKDGHVRRRDYHGQSSLLLLSPFNSFFFVVVFLREETYCCLWVLFSWNRAQTLTQVKCPGAKTNGKEQKIFSCILKALKHSLQFFLFWIQPRISRTTTFERNWNQTPLNKFE